MNRIGGPADYRLLAELFRDPEALPREARKLARLGLYPRDIAQALGCQPDQVARWLAEDRDE